MSMNWIDPKLIIGNKATGTYYFPRPKIEAAIVTEIEKGNHVLVAAPRRVGKTSVMAFVSENYKDGCKCILENIQGIDEEDALYKRIYELILTCLKKDRQIWENAQKWIKGIKVSEIGLDGKIKFGETKAHNFKELIDDIIPQLPDGLKLVLFLDELPEVLHQLNKKGKKSAADSVLKNLRRWRQGDEFKSLCLVVTGSVGLQHIVANITGRATDNNDYGNVDFPPFGYEQGYEFIEHVTKDATVRYTPALKHHLLDKLGYKIPYFINLVLSEVNKKAKQLSDPSITLSAIDEAFDKVVTESRQFKDWKQRLFDYFEKSNADYMNEVLINLAHNKIISKRKLYDLAIKHKKNDNYMELVTILIDDGYLVENEKGYVFLSPFLSAFWLKDNPIYND